MQIRDLKRISFRPNNDDWLELGELALAFGKSRCYVFTFLLELDLLGVLNILYESGLDRAVPTKNGLLLKVSFSLSSAILKELDFLKLSIYSIGLEMEYGAGKFKKNIFFLNFD